MDTLQADHIMTVYGPLDPPQVINDQFYIYNVSDGGRARGPHFNGKIIPPAADWLRLLPGGEARMDVRFTIKTDDGALIYGTYNGVSRHTPESLERFMAGELLTGEDFYFCGAPTFETSAEPYLWMNGIQTITRLISMHVGDESHIKYDVFTVR